MTYIIKETTHVNADTDRSVKYEGTLRGAKLFASTNQIFYGTTLKIETVSGQLVAYKEAGEKWVNVETF